MGDLGDVRTKDQAGMDVRTAMANCACQTSSGLGSKELLLIQ